MSPPVLSMRPGDIRSGPVRTLTLARVLALSGGPLDKPGWPDKNLHTDAQAAAAAGLPHIVASGTQWEGHMAGLLVDTMGMAWFNGGCMNVKVPRSVQIGESLVARLQLDAIVQTGGGHATAEFTVWCENAQAQQVLVGTATCPMPRSGEEDAP